MDDDLPDGTWGPDVKPGEIAYIDNKVFHIDTCETSNGNAYELYFAQQDDGRIRIEILKQPDYGSRDSSLRTTYRQQDGSCFCIDTRAYELKTLGYAKQVAADWV